MPKTPRRKRPRVIAPLKQFGALWVETVELFDPEAQKRRAYDFIYVRHRTVRGKLELRLARINEVKL